MIIVFIVYMIDNIMLPIHQQKNDEFDKLDHMFPKLKITVYSVSDAYDTCKDKTW